MDDFAPLYKLSDGFFLYVIGPLLFLITKRGIFLKPLFPNLILHFLIYSLRCSYCIISVIAIISSFNKTNSSCNCYYISVSLCKYSRWWDMPTVFITILFHAVIGLQKMMTSLAYHIILLQLKRFGFNLVENLLACFGERNTHKTTEWFLDTRWDNINNHV